MSSKRGKLTPSQQRKVYTCTGDSIQLTKFQPSAQPTDSSQPPFTDSGHQTASKSVRKSHLSLETVSSTSTLGDEGYSSTRTSGSSILSSCPSKSSVPSIVNTSQKLENQTLNDDPESLIAISSLRRSVSVKGSVRGSEVIGANDFTVSTQGIRFEWKGYGLKVHVLKESLPVGKVESRVNIEASISGQFQLPEDSDLLSPIFWIFAPFNFTKPVTLEIQHCALIEDGTVFSDLSFVSANCSESEPPYIFKQLEGGVFPTDTSYGSIQLCHFSWFAITGRRRTSRSYCAYLYHTMRMRCDWRYYFIITQDVDAKITVVRKHYSGFASEEATLRVRFEGSEITLDIPVDGLVTREGWRITPLTFPTISRKDADQFKPGLLIPECQLIVQWTKEHQKPVQVLHKVNLIGAKEPCNFIRLILNATMEDVGSPNNGPAEYSQEQRPNLCQLISFGVRSGNINVLEQIGTHYWELGVQLLDDTTGAVTKAIVEQYQNNATKINREILQRWIQGGGKLPVEWDTLVKVLKDIRLSELASEIEQALR